MSVSVNIRRIPNFLKARSPLFLRRLCLRKNLLDSTEYKYTIIHDGSSWYAWYYEEAKMKIDLIEGTLKETIDEKKEKVVEKEKEKVTNG